MKTLFFLALSISAFSQVPADNGHYKLAFMDDRLLFKYSLSNVLKTDTVGYEEFVIPEGIKPGEKWIVSFKKIETSLPDKVTRIDDTDPRITYSGTWFKQASTSTIVWPDNFLNKNVSYTQTANAYSELKFFGTGIEAVSELRDNHATATVFIDGIKVADVDMYKATQINAPTIIYSKKDLVKGDHTIRVQLTGISGAKNSLVMDGYTIYEKQ